MELNAEALDWAQWTWPQLAAYWAVVVVGQEGMSIVLHALAALSSARIPDTGKHLDSLGFKDWAFVWFNRLSVPFVTYYTLRYMISSPNVEWDVAKVSLTNTPLAALLCFAVYDVVYVPFHWFLHLRSVYPLIHKHHHKQAAPSRGNVDASNTHPIEFVLGAWIHLLALAVVSSWAVPCHAMSVLIFIGGGGVLASLNHTRLDIKIPLFYTVRAHDTHHHYPTANYGQYGMFVDKLMGSYRPPSAPKTA